MKYRSPTVGFLPVIEAYTTILLVFEESVEITKATKTIVKKFNSRECWSNKFLMQGMLSTLGPQFLS